MTPYQQYQLEWMLAHDKSLDDLISELTLSLETELEEYEDARDAIAYTSLTEIYNGWQFNQGFGGEIWVCENEFNDSVESQPDICTPVVAINLDMLNDVIHNITDVDDEIKDSLTLADYQQIATTAAKTTFNEEEIINPTLDALYRNLQCAAEAILQQK